jgi:membrane fusion protein (multidrug efflux system)
LLIILGLLLLPFGALWAATDQTSAKPEAEVLSERDFPITIQYAAVLQGVKTVNVIAQNPGTVLSRSFTEGSLVQIGQVLYELDSHTVETSLVQAQSMVDAATARLNLAKSQEGRAANLFKSNTITKRDYEAAQTALASAEADYKASVSALDEMRRAADLSEVKAPVTGYVGKALKDPGDLVNPGPDSLLTTIENISSMLAVFQVPNSHFRTYRAMERSFGLDASRGKLPARLFVDGIPYEHPGELEYGEAKMDPASGLMPSQALFPNPNLDLLSGQIARVQLLVLVIPKALAVPESAVFDGPSGKSLALVENGTLKVVKADISYGPFSGYYLLSDKGAVKTGAVILKDGLGGFREGQQVSPQIVEYGPLPGAELLALQDEPGLAADAATGADVSARGATTTSEGDNEGGQTGPTSAEGSEAETDATSSE